MAYMHYAEEPWLVDRCLVVVNGVGGVEDSPSILVGELCFGVMIAIRERYYE
jgi:hypothetical protein